MRIQENRTREHRAWEMLIRRLDYLNSFSGNRSEMEKTTRIVAQIWDDTGHEEELEDPETVGKMGTFRKRVPMGYFLTAIGVKQ